MLHWHEIRHGKEVMSMWLTGSLVFGTVVVMWYIARRDMCLEIRRRELLVILADLEALAEEGEIFREEEPYQILHEYTEALLPLVKGWSLRRLYRAIKATRFHKETIRIGRTGRVEKSPICAPEIKHLTVHLNTCATNIFLDRSWYVRVMSFLDETKNPLIMCHIVQQIVCEAGTKKPKTY